jgi:hypothetical protein
MQLLRDGLYRACEAYMNGAIGRTAYTAILANYDTMMMTMMFGETAAGNFGSLATLGGAAAAGGARADMAAAEARLKAAVDTHTAALRAQKEADDAVASKRADLETESKKDQPDASTVSRLRDAVTDADKQARQRRDAAELARSERFAAEQALRAAGGAVSAQAEANAQAGREGAPGGDVGRTLHDLQREYFILPRGTSALLTCMQAADDVAERTIHALPDYCAGLLGSLPQAITNAQTRRYNLQVYEHQLAYVRALADLYRAADAAKIPPAQRQRDLERQPPTPSAPR